MSEVYVLAYHHAPHPRYVANHKHAAVTCKTLDKARKMGPLSAKFWEKEENIKAVTYAEAEIAHIAWELTGVWPLSIHARQNVGISSDEQ